MIRWGDRRHWEVFAGRFRISRWCPGAPCHLEGVHRERHWISVSTR